MVYKKFFLEKFNAKLAYRYFAGRSNDFLIICVPGGPGLSNEYMVQFCRALAKTCKNSVILIDLPNHDKSMGFKNLQYSDILKIIEAFILEQLNVSSEIVLIGHSFGSKIALDVSFKIQNKISKLILLNFPIKTTIKFKSKVLKLEKNFKTFWASIIPHYFAKFKKNYARVLLQKTSWCKNGYLNRRGLNVSAYIRPSLSIHKIKKYVVLCENDLFFKGNETQLFNIIGKFNFDVIKDTGHFPMIESKQELLKVINKRLQ